MKRWLVGSAIGYVALMALCAVGLRALPPSTQSALGPYLWLLGPPANLVHGTNYLWMFAIGSVVVASLGFGITRTESPGVQVASGIALVVAWAFFGFVVYAPGA